MTACDRILSVTKEQIVTCAKKKGFIRKFAEKIGLAQKEVLECRGKSLNEMAKMMSEKDRLELYKKQESVIKRIINVFNTIQKERRALSQEVEQKVKMTVENVI